MTTSSAASRLLVQAPIVFVSGKGGVGKTTVAAALAVHAHRAGERVVLVEFDDGRAGVRALGRAGADISHAVLTYDHALVETLGQLLGAKILARAIVSQRAIRRLIRAVPALREFVFLDRIRALATAGHYQRIIVDLPSSGHALDWLRVPQAFERFLGRSPLGTMGRRIHDEVLAKGRVDVVVVTLAEPLVVKETEQLCRRLRSELGIAPALVVVNRTVAPDPADAWEAAHQIADSNLELGAAARELLGVIEARRQQADDTEVVCRLVRSLDAGRVLFLGDTIWDPAASEVADRLVAEAFA